MKTNLSLFLFLALFAVSAWNLPASPVAEKCETYEEDCDRSGQSDDEEPVRPGDEDGPDSEGDGL